MSERRRLKRHSLFLNIHNNLAPKYLSDLMPPLIGPMSDYNLRNNNYILPNCRLEITKKNLSFHLPLHIGIGLIKRQEIPECENI